MDARSMRILDRMRRLCSRREYSRSDIRKKVQTALSPFFVGDDDTLERETASVLEELEKDRYFDDSRYAQAFARDKSSISGWGPAKIRYALAAKGIARETIAEALSATDPEASRKKLEKTAMTKYKSLKEDPQCRLKLLRFILGRGYGYEEARAAVERVMAEDENLTK